MTLTMNTETDPNELAWQLPANRWTPLVLERLSNDTRREEFVRQCAYCHQQGSWATRVQRSDEDWHAIFIKMGRMGGTISPELQKELPAALNAAYDDKNYLAKLTEPEFVAPPAPEGRAATAVITEWQVGTPASMLHDIAVHPDGAIWAVDTGGDRLYRLDPRTNQREEFPIPTGDSPDRRRVPRNRTSRVAGCDRTRRAAQPASCVRRYDLGYAMPWQQGGASQSAHEGLDDIRAEGRPVSAHDANRSQGKGLVHAGGQQRRRDDRSFDRGTAGLPVAGAELFAGDWRFARCRS